MFVPTFNAIQSRLEGDSKLSGKIAETIRRTMGGDPVRENYVILFPTAPRSLADDRFMAVQSVDSRATWEFDTRIVATTSDAVGALADAVVGRLVGHVLVIPGRTCTRITLDPDESGAVEYDKTAQLYYQDLTFGFVSDRSA